jgi:DUF1365 family protein
MTGAAVYFGGVTHARLRPVRHAMRYGVFSLLLDLDTLADDLSRLRLLSHNRANLFSFHERDHGDGSVSGLRGQVAALLAGAGIVADGPVRLLCMPRLLGYVFNPLSIYFCHRRDGSLAAILYQVHNTFGQRHAYLLAAAPDAAGVVRQECAKRFYVSPFMDMEMTYRFRIRPPDANVAVVVEGCDAAGTMFVATLTGHRRELSDATLLRALLRYPLLTLKVIGGIHWEALKLWRKGLRLRPRPPPPAEPVSSGMASHNP